MKAIIISGFSGAGKSTALRTLEDDGFYCIDHLPIEIIDAATEHILSKNARFGDKIAINIDARNFHQDYLGQFNTLINKLRETKLDVVLVFLEANNQTIIRRYNEARRPHPLSKDKKPIEEAIEFEREQLAEIASQADMIINTDLLTPYQLGNMIRKICKIPRDSFMLLQSFAYKNNIPPNSNYVFDLRGLPNPYWNSELKTLNGKDEAVVEYLDEQHECQQMLEDIRRCIDGWLPRLVSQGHKNLVISLGCTGGQHRSVYMVERLYDALKDRQNYIVEKKHLEIS